MIMVVDNNRKRLNHFDEILRQIYLNDKIETYVDPFLAVQHSEQHEIKLAFVNLDVIPIGGLAVSKLIRQFNDKARIFLILNSKEKESMIDYTNIEGYVIDPVDEGTVRNLLF